MSKTPRTDNYAAQGREWIPLGLFEEAEREKNEAVAFIKSLNAIKGEHARVYRARCGRFLAGLKEGKE
jgi:hypothetical protein